MGVPFYIDQQLLEKCREDADKNDPLAILCLKKLMEHTSQLRIFKELLESNLSTFIYWHPCPELKGDRFLSMF